MEIVLEFH